MSHSRISRKGKKKKLQSCCLGEVIIFNCCDTVVQSTVTLFNIIFSGGSFFEEHDYVDLTRGHFPHEKVSLSFPHYKRKISDLFSLQNLQGNINISTSELGLLTQFQDQ